MANQELTYDLVIEINKSLKNIEQFVDKAGSKAGQSGKNAGQEYGMSFGKTVGAIVTSQLVVGAFEKLGEGIAGGLKYSIDTAANFEKAMNGVKAVSAASGNQFIKLRQQALDLGIATEFSSTQAAEGQKYLAMAGFDANQVLAAMPAVIDLASAGQLDLGRAADITATIMGQFGIEATEASKVTNLLAAAAASSNTDVEQLSEAMKYLGPTAKSMGISIEETAAIIGVLGDAGIQGSLAGRALGTSLVRLANPTEKMQGALDTLGVSAFDVNGKFVGMAPLLADIQNGMKGMTDEQKNANIMSVFGAEAFQEINILLERGSEKYANYTKEITGTTKAEEIAKIQRQGLAMAFERFASSIETVAIKIMDMNVNGKSITEWLTIAVGAAEKFISSFDWSQVGTAINNTVDKLKEVKKFIEDNQKTIENIVIILGSFATAWAIVNGAIAIYTGVIALATGITTAFGVALAFVTSPIGIAILAIGAIIAIVWLLWNNWDTVIGFLKGALDGLVGFFKWVWDGIVAIFNGFITWLSANFVDMLIVALALLTGPIGWLSLFIAKNWDTIKDLFNKGVEFVVNSGKRIADGFLNAFSSLKDSVSSIFKGIFNGINGVINKGIDGINSMIGGIDIPGVGKITIPRLPQFANGGLVQGAGTSTSDSILAKLSNGEFVMNARAVQMNGMAKLNAMNNGKVDNSRHDNDTWNITNIGGVLPNYSLQSQQAI